MLRLVASSDEDERLRLLQAVPALQGAHLDALLRLLPHLDEGHMPAGHVLAGSLASPSVAVVVEGTVEARAADGTCRLMGRGASLGHVAGCEAPGSGEVVRAVTPVVVVLLPARRFSQARSEIADPVVGCGRIHGAGDRP